MYRIEMDTKEDALLRHFRTAIRDYYHAGSPWPSTRAFGREMTREIGSRSGPRRILEVGPGCGPMTRHILAELRPGDEFDLVEISEPFCDVLEERFLQRARTQHPKVRIELHCHPIQTAPLEGEYDFVISSLPLNNFHPNLVREILGRFRQLLAPNGQLNFFEYVGIRPLGCIFGIGNKRRRLAEITQIIREFDREPGVKKSVFLFNLPPATKRSLCPVIAK